jgi:hypothetical protein
VRVSHCSNRRLVPAIALSSPGLGVQGRDFDMQHGSLNPAALIID